MYIYVYIYIYTVAHNVRILWYLNLKFSCKIGHNQIQYKFRFKIDSSSSDKYKISENCSNYCAKIAIKNLI